jgi:two-component system, NarL family, invasion response regulator UvrY
VPTGAQDGGRDPVRRGHHRDPVAVLVVDDQESFRSVLRDLVAATEGFTLIGEAASGESALSAAQELSPRLVIMDKRMPGMSGIEATRGLIDRHPEVVVLLISVEEAPDPHVLRSCGAAAFAWKQQLSPALLREVWRRHGGCTASRGALLDT